MSAGILEERTVDFLARGPWIFSGKRAFSATGRKRLRIFWRK